MIALQEPAGGFLQDQPFATGRAGSLTQPLHDGA